MTRHRNVAEPVSRRPYYGHRPDHPRHAKRPAACLGLAPISRRPTNRWADRASRLGSVEAAHAGWQSGRQARLARKAAARRYAARRYAEKSRQHEAEARAFVDGMSARGKPLV